MKLVPVILSGGAGTRLWPLSRELLPKQLLALTSERTMLQETVARFAGLPGVCGPLIVCNEAHRFLVAEQLREMQVVPTAILLEPEGRNTAPAIALAAHAAFTDYEVVVAAGAKAGQGAAAKPPVDDAIATAEKAKTSGSITLTCGKLMTGVTVPQWGTILMLRSLKSPESYFQAASHGMEARILLDDDRPRPAPEVARETLDATLPYARELGADAAFEELERILREGNGADEQRRVHRERGMAGLLAHLAERTR